METHAESLSPVLQTARVNRQALHLLETASTNAFALDWDAPDGSYVFTDTQTQGRGRLGRQWQSPPHRGVYFSIINPFPFSSALTPLWGALAAARALESLAPVKIACKWPNDLLCRGQKIGGLLCESRGGKLVLGIGLNFNHRLHELPLRPVFPASSLFLLSGREWDVGAGVRALVEAIDAGGFSMDEYGARLHGVGEIVRIGGEIGVLRGVSTGGALRIQTVNGEKEVLGGELTFV